MLNYGLAEKRFKYEMICLIFMFYFWLYKKSYVKTNIIKKKICTKIKINRI